MGVGSYKNFVICLVYISISIIMCIYVIHVLLSPPPPPGPYPDPRVGNGPPDRQTSASSTTAV